jgi:hypothetical protein
MHRSPYLANETSWDAYQSGLSKNLRQDLRRRKRRLEQEGRLTLEVCDGTDNLHKLLEDFAVVSFEGSLMDKLRRLQRSECREPAKNLDRGCSPKCLEEAFWEAYSLLVTASFGKDVPLGGCAYATMRIFLPFGQGGGTYRYRIVAETIETVILT